MPSKLQTGDIFSIPMSKDEHLFGRVLLDVLEQCIKPRRILTSSMLAFFKEAHLVEVTRDEAGSEIVVSSYFTYAVEKERIGHRPVDPTKVEFPWTLSLRGPQPHFYWGELALPIDLPLPEFRKILVSPAIAPVNGLGPLALYQMGRRDEIDRATYEDVEIFAPGRNDLRFSEHRARIQELVAGRVLEDYYSTALAYGYDLRRLYSADEGKRELVLCAYCCAALPPSGDACSVCAQPIGRDAPIEETVDELAVENRNPCKVCTAPILKIATICRWCRSRQ